MTRYPFTWSKQNYPYGRRVDLRLHSTYFLTWLMGNLCPRLILCKAFIQGQLSLLILFRNNFWDIFCVSGLVDLISFSILFTDYFPSDRLLSFRFLNFRFFFRLLSSSFRFFKMLQLSFSSIEQIYLLQKVSLIFTIRSFFWKCENFLISLFYK